MALALFGLAIIILVAGDFSWQAAIPAGLLFACVIFVSAANEAKSEKEVK